MYDLLVLTFNEKRHSHLRMKKICVKALNKNGRTKQKYYYEIWPFINNCHGILYKLFTNGSFGEFECCDEMFEFDDSHTLDCSLHKIIPNLEDESVEDLVSIKLKSKYKEEFILLFDLLLSCSPISTIAFLCRGQSTDKEIVVGTISHGEFLELLYSGNIKTNVCYLVENNHSPDNK